MGDEPALMLLDSAPWASLLRQLSGVAVFLCEFTSGDHQEVLPCG